MYLDNAATTKVHPEVLKEMQNISFANYNAKYYQEAVDVKNKIDKSIKIISEILNIKEKNIVFTSGATESNNYIIKGIYANHPKGHYITSKKEHKSVLETFKYIESLGANVTYIDSKEDYIDVEDIKKEIKEDTKLVSIMAVNNETGIINKVEDISKYLKEKNILFHTDATQALGKIKIDYSLFDYISLSSHKINGPKGIGLAVVNQPLVPLLHGSNQQNGNRAGTLPNELIVGFTKAIELSVNNFEENKKMILVNKKIIISFLEESLGDDLIYNFNNNVVDNILSVQIKGEVNQIFLNENKEIIKASTGSSCSINEPSYVLKDYNFDEEQIRQTIRISLPMYEKLRIEN